MSEDAELISTCELDEIEEIAKTHRHRRIHGLEEGYECACADILRLCATVRRLGREMCAATEETERGYQHIAARDAEIGRLQAEVERIRNEWDEDVEAVKIAYSHNPGR